METNQVIHIAGSLILIGGVSFYFHTKIGKLTGKINDLTKVIDSQNKRLAIIESQLFRQRPPVPPRFFHHVSPSPARMVHHEHVEVIPERKIDEDEEEVDKEDLDRELEDELRELEQVEEKKEEVEEVDSEEIEIELEKEEPVVEFVDPEQFKKKRGRKKKKKESSVNN